MNAQYRFLHAISVLAVHLAAACSSPVDLDRDPEAPIQTERLQYELQRTDDAVQADISYTFTNKTETPVFIVNCNGSTAVRLEKRVEGQWTVAWGNIVPACLSPPIVVDAGESVTRTLFVYGGDPGCSCAPKFSVEDREGIYRIVLTNVLESFDEDAYRFGPTAPKRYRVSNAFQLTE